VYPTQIQHVVVIVMENRSMDNLFAGYYGASWQGGSTPWQGVMNIANPNGSPMLAPRPLYTAKAKSFDPNHEHDAGFLQEIINGWGLEKFGCPNGPNNCPRDATALAYVPTNETTP
jgi:phospholipase C